MNTSTWIALGGLAVAAASLCYTWWKNRPTSESSLPTINAENRAEEALQIDKAREDRDRQRFEQEKADIDAPQVAELWVTDIHFKWRAHSRHGQYDLTKDAKTPAERAAVEILQKSKESLRLIGVEYDPVKQVCNISGWDALGCKRNSGEPGNPPKLGGAE